MRNQNIASYIELLRAFLGETIDTRTFERDYLCLSKNERALFPSGIFEVLDGLFADVDAFCPDSSLRSEDDLREDQLRESCRKALEKLERGE